jgi:alpha-tubulin suppressor-like RCC1 family protein
LGFLYGISKISAGGWHTVSLKSDNTVWTWGYNQYGQLGDGTSGAGTDKATPVQVKGPEGAESLNEIIAIAAGGDHTVTLRNDGTVWAFGWNGDGELGDGTITKKTTPVQVLSPDGLGHLTGISSINAGFYFSMALSDDGYVWMWGDNRNGQLGDGTSGTGSNKLIPVQVKGLNGIGFLNEITTLAAGYYHTVIIKSDGRLWSWGWNVYGQLGDETNIDKCTPVQVTNTP